MAVTASTEVMTGMFQKSFASRISPTHLSRERFIPASVAADSTSSIIGNFRCFFKVDDFGEISVIISGES